MSVRFIRHFTFLFFCDFLFININQKVYLYNYKQRLGKNCIWIFQNFKAIFVTLINSSFPDSSHKKSRGWLSLSTYFRNQSWFILAVSLGLLSCRCVYLLPRFSFLADEIKVFSNITWYIAPFIFMNTPYNTPVPIADKHVMILPLVYFLAGVVFLGLDTHTVFF